MFGIGPLELIIVFVIGSFFLIGIGVVLYVINREGMNRPPGGGDRQDSNRDDAGR